MTPFPKRNITANIFVDPTLVDSLDSAVHSISLIESKFATLGYFFSDVGASMPSKSESHGSMLQMIRNAQRNGLYFSKHYWSDLHPCDRDLVISTRVDVESKSENTCLPEQVPSSTAFLETSPSILIPATYKSYTEQCRRLLFKATEIDIIDRYIDFGQGASAWLLDCILDSCSHDVERIRVHVGQDKGPRNRTINDIINQLEKWIRLRCSALKFEVSVVSWHTSLHDRFLFTNRHVVNLTKGFVLSRNGELSTWTILEKDQSDYLRRQVALEMLNKRTDITKLR